MARATAEFAGATVEEAKDYLREHIDDGTRCPVCTQYAKVYRRKITKSSAEALFRLYRSAGLGWAHWPTVNRGFRADECKLEYWGLVEEERTLRPDGGRAGWWRVTPLGKQWLSGEIGLPKYARVFDGGCLGLTGPQQSVHDALGERFNLAELMAGV